MPARSPHRHSPVPAPPAPPRISRRTPPPSAVKRGRSMDRQRGSSGPGPSRRRDFREGSPPQRRSRSPMRRGMPKGPPVREFQDAKRKLSPPPAKKSRREGRRQIGSPEVKQTRDKSPPVRRERSSRPFGEGAAGSAGYSAALDGQSRLTRTVGSGDRFRGGGDFDEEGASDRPIFRGPETSIRFDPNELKRISVEIVRRNLLPPETQVINRAIVNPEEITPVRRPEVDYGDKMSQPPHGRIREPPHSPSHRPSQHSPPRHLGHSNNRPRSPLPWGWNHQSSTMDNYSQPDHMGYSNEGSRPIFDRDELMNSDRSLAPPVEQRRIVAMPPVRSRSPADRERSRIRSPVPLREPQGYSYPDRERDRSPYDSRPPPRDHLDSRERKGDRYQSRGDDLRHELDRRRDEPPPSHYRAPEYRENSGSYSRPRDNESDLRARISEKRSDPHLRREERERERHDVERERHRSQRSPLPPTTSSRDKRRGSPDLGPSRFVDRDVRDRELWERERERERDRDREGADRKRRARSRDLEDDRRASGSRRQSSVERFPDPLPDRKERKPEYEERGSDREFYEREDFPGSSRGARGGSMRRPVPHPGARGMPPRFRPPVIPMRMPPFIPVRGGFRPHMPRGFSPRIGFFPPPFRPFFM